MILSHAPGRLVNVTSRVSVSNLLDRGMKPSEAQELNLFNVSLVEDTGERLDPGTGVIVCVGALWKPLLPALPPSRRPHPTTHPLLPSPSPVHFPPLLATSCPHASSPVQAPWPRAEYNALSPPPSPSPAPLLPPGESVERFLCHENAHYWPLDEIDDSYLSPLDDPTSSSAAFHATFVLDTGPAGGFGPMATLEGDARLSAGLELSGGGSGGGSGDHSFGRVALPPLTVGSSALSVAAWVYVSDFSTGMPVIELASAEVRFAFGIHRGDDGQISARVGLREGVGATTQEATWSLNLANRIKEVTWHHLALVLAAPFATVFVDGVAHSGGSDNLGAFDLAATYPQA